MNELDFTAEGYRAKVAYEAYARSTGGKTFDGRDMPAWTAAAGAVARHAGSVPCDYEGGGEG